MIGTAPETAPLPITPVGFVILGRELINETLLLLMPALSLKSVGRLVTVDKSAALVTVELILMVPGVRLDPGGIGTFVALGEELNVGALSPLL